MQKILGSYGKKFIAFGIGVIVSTVLMILNKKFGLELETSEVLAPSIAAAVQNIAQGLADAFSKGATSSVAVANVKAINEAIPPPPSAAPPSN